MLRFGPVPSALESSCPIHSAIGAIAFSNKVSGIINILERQRFEPELLDNFLS